jgi:hypothetical protein
MEKSNELALRNTSVFVNKKLIIKKIVCTKCLFKLVSGKYKSIVLSYPDD